MHLVSLAQLETWHTYQEQLQLLSQNPELRKARIQISEMQTVPDVTNPENVLFERIPLCVSIQSLSQDHTIPKPESKTDINQKIFLWCGDVLKLKVDAIIVGTNKLIMRESGGLNQKVFEKGGQSIDEDITFRTTDRLISNCALRKEKPSPNKSGLQDVHENGEESKEKESTSGEAIREHDFYDELEPGQTVISKAYELQNCKYVLFSLPPQLFQPPQLLYNCYCSIFDKVSSLNSCFEGTDENEAVTSGLTPIRSIALTCIGTGIYQYPEVLAANIALSVTRKYLETDSTKLEKIVFVVHDGRQQEIYEELMTYYFPNPFFFESPIVELFGTNKEAERDGGDIVAELTADRFPSPPSKDPAMNDDDE